VPDLGLSVLPAPDVTDPLVFRDSAAFRQIFEADLKAFDLIVIDTSPVTEAPCDAIPPEVVAAASAATVLVIMAGVTPEQSVMRAVERLKKSGATLAGAVFNDRFNPTLASEIQRRTRLLSKMAPTLAARLVSRIDRSPWLGADAR
jgi:Mrp family chromosome partitioning ATPase